MPLSPFSILSRTWDSLPPWSKSKVWTFYKINLIVVFSSYTAPFPWFKHLNKLLTHFWKIIILLINLYLSLPSIILKSYSYFSTLWFQIWNQSFHLRLCTAMETGFQLPMLGEQQPVPECNNTTLFLKNGFFTSILFISRNNTFLMARRDLQKKKQHW